MNRLFFIGIGLFLTISVYAQADGRFPKAKDESPQRRALTEQAEQPSMPTSASLSVKQKGVSEQFQRLEGILLRMAEISSPTNSKRTEILKKALAQSKDKWLELRLSESADLLEKKRFADAISQQQEIESVLREMLKLLESENRAQYRDEERKKIEAILKDLERITLEQRAILAKTEKSSSPQDFAPGQKQIGEKTDLLSQQMCESQEIGPESPDDKASPAQKAMQNAKSHIRSAQEQLENGEKENSLEEQDAAVAALQNAKAELQRILNQMREEELMERLNSLETRFRRMLQIEKVIRAQSEKLDKQEQTYERTLQLQILRLSNDQNRVIQEADIAILLIREGATGKAFEESLLQCRFDMSDVETLLSDFQVGKNTQLTLDLIIESLQEMLLAVEKAKKESEERQKQQQQENGSDSGDTELLSIISELKMIRSMQKRVYDRTKLYETQVRDDQLQKRLDELTRSQARLTRILNELRIDMLSL